VSAHAYSVTKCGELKRHQEDINNLCRVSCWLYVISEQLLQSGHS